MRLILGLWDCQYLTEVLEDPALVAQGKMVENTWSKNSCIYSLYQYFIPILLYTNTILYTNTFNSDVIILIATIFELILYETGTGTLCTDALFNSIRIKFHR